MCSRQYCFRCSLILFCAFLYYVSLRFLASLHEVFLYSSKSYLGGRVILTLPRDAIYVNGKSTSLNGNGNI